MKTKVSDTCIYIAPRKDNRKFYKEIVKQHDEKRNIDNND